MQRSECIDAYEDHGKSMEAYGVNSGVKGKAEPVTRKWLVSINNTLDQLVWLSGFLDRINSFDALLSTSIIATYSTTLLYSGPAC